MASGLSPGEAVGAAAGVDFHGAIAITVAHELMHRTTVVERRLAVVLMLSCAYPHFSIEHVQGQHKRVGMPADRGRGG